MRTALFILSLILHLIFLNWLIHIDITIKPLAKEKIITVTPISQDKFILPWESKPSKSPSRKPAAPVISGAPSKKDSRITSTEIPSSPEDLLNADLLPSDPFKKTPPPKTQPSSVPNLSLYSPTMRKILTDFNRQKPKKTIGNILSGGGDAFDGVVNYNIKPWTKRALLSIQKNWTIPLINPKNPECPVEITTVIEKSGKISSMKIKKSCAVDLLDQAALNALTLSSPLPPLPDDFPFENVETSFMFNYDWRQ